MADNKKEASAESLATIAETKANVNNSNVIIARKSKYAHLKEEQPREYYSNVYEELNDKIYFINNDIYYYSIKYSGFKKVSRLELNDMVALDYPFYKPPLKTFKDGKAKKNTEPVLPSEYLSQLSYKHEYLELEKRVNLFQKEAFRIETSGAKIILTKNEQSFMNYSFEYDEAIKAECVEDYKNHFPQFDDLLDFIVAIRFAVEKRGSFVHLHLNAGWGKNFFMELLKEVNLGLEARYDDFKSPTAISEIEFNNKMVMFIDEFTVFKKEFKGMIDKVILDTKNQLRTSIPLYTKIFLSAEASPSFSEGVDKQIKDRMNVIHTAEVKELGSRPVFRKYGNKAFFNSVKEYANNKLKARFNEYLEMEDEIEASKRADSEVLAFNKKYPITSDDLEVVIKQRVLIRIKELISADTNEELSFKEQDILKKIITTDKFVYLLNPKATLDLIIELEDDAFKSKAKYKKANIEDILGYTIKNHKINKVAKRSMRLPLNELPELEEEAEAEPKIEVPTTYETIEENEEIPF